ncbi:hybrid sensor histidine kinase/response regulator [Stigmatella hybrida]|uniref:hypothetical protein n=1 Tax=Stigmatella hybrida TaxID=394097 RepID=UPI001CDADBF0|nr:hypothetical protein [Stigmatella hybrida]
MRQAQKMEAVGQLTGGIAHDFNNLEAATSSAMRAASLTHQLLAFARRQSLDVKPTDINVLVASMEELLRCTLGENIVLRMALEPRLWPALTDSNQFENALLNQVINARDAMPDGGTLTVATRRWRREMPSKPCRTSKAGSGWTCSSRMWACRA